MYFCSMTKNVPRFVITTSVYASTRSIHINIDPLSAPSEIRNEFLSTSSSSQVGANEFYFLYNGASAVSQRERRGFGEREYIKAPQRSQIEILCRSIIDYTYRHSRWIQSLTFFP